MLKTLHIKKFALIDSLELEFSKGLNIITGETGAGKSIIVDSLMLLLGERASSDFIREGESKAVIEGEFFLDKNHSVFKLLEESGLDSNNEEMILRRELSNKGTSRCFINDSPVQLSFLKKIGDVLVDFHGQHDHQILLNKEAHLGILDNVADTAELKKKYLSFYNEQKKLISSLNDLSVREKSLKEKEETYRFELKELSNVAPVENEDDLLERELRIKENSEYLFNETTELLNILNVLDSSVNNGINQTLKILDNLKKIEPGFNSFYDETKTMSVTLDEIINFTADYHSNIDFNAERIEVIRERLQVLKGMKKRYGSIKSAIERMEVLEKEISTISHFDEELRKLKNEIRSNKIDLGVIAANLSNRRNKYAKTFEKAIIDVLKSLGVDSAVFRVIFNKEEIIDKNYNYITATIEGKDYLANNQGADIVEFYISTNKGEIPKPLIQVASGGEISRIMLAIKSIVAETGELPILVFDEIDIGISGKIARKVGLTMNNLGKYHQIIAITHLPQIAALAERNIAVKKTENKERTYIDAFVLDAKEKVNEIAKLLSGESVTETSLKSAKELMKIE